MLLETACHELYLTTELTSSDIILQNNFKSFRIFLTYLKTRLSASSSGLVRGTTGEQQNRKKFTLNELTTTYDNVSITIF